MLSQPWNLASLSTENVPIEAQQHVSVEARGPNEAVPVEAAVLSVQPPFVSVGAPPLNAQADACPPSKRQAACLMNLIRTFIKPRSYTTLAPIGNNWFRCCVGIVGISIPMWPKFHTAPPTCSTAYASQALLSPPAPPHGANNVSSLPYSVVPTNRHT
jgi:hypothetical protein